MKKYQVIVTIDTLRKEARTIKFCNVSTSTHWDFITKKDTPIKYKSIDDLISTILKIAKINNCTITKYSCLGSFFYDIYFCSMQDGTIERYLYTGDEK